MGDVAPWPRPGTEVVVDRYELRVGGAAGNTGLALAALGLELGQELDAIGSVGDDAMGRWLEQQLEGVMRLTRAPTETALTVGLTHPDGQRTFVSYLGHLGHLPEERVAAALESAQEGDLLLLCGYFLMPRLRELAPSLLKQARARGVVTALDSGWPPAGWTPAVRQELLNLLPDLSVFLPNREELLGVTDVPDVGAYEPAAVELALSLLSQHGGERCVVKLGADGALYSGPDGRAAFAAPAVKVQDTVGAGDTFNAGLLSAVQRGQDWKSALRPAVLSASLAISSTPRRYPTWDELASSAPQTAPA
jgi:sugar/nucleoside kinase (ribokinase family)